MKCTKAIIAVAGYGTRRLPITKAVEKCMLPLLNRPIVDYVVEDCVRAGITDIYFVVSQGANQLRHYYHRDLFLEDYLIRNNKKQYIEGITPPKDVQFHFIEQDTLDPRYGTTIPVWLCRDVVEPNEHVLIIMGDQCFYREDGGSEAMELLNKVRAKGADGGAVGVEVPIEEVEKYGVIEKTHDDNYVRIVEHPKPEEAPSNLNNGSVYLLPHAFMAYTEKQMEREHDGKEYFLIDAVNEFVNDGHNLTVYSAKGEYLDCGTVEGWVAANNYLWDLKQSSGAGK